jgi:serine/threonine-protein kinase
MDAPSITMVRRTVPPNVGAALAKSLEKLPADRFTTVADFANALADEGFTYRARAGTSSLAVSPAPPAPVARSGPWNRLAITMTVVASVATLVAALGWFRTVPEPGVPTRVELTDTDLAGVGGWRLAISPDGRSILKVEDDAIHIRSSENPEWRPLANAEGGRFPTVSPDGQWVAFSRDGIWKVSTSGGPALPVTSAGSAPQWGSDDTIVYDDEGRLYRVPSSGGEPDLLLDSDSMRVRTPHLLPDGRAVVFSLQGGGLTSRILVLEIGTGDVRELVSSGNQPRYVPTGHLVYGYEGALMGVAFDIGSLQVTGAPVTLIPSLEVFSGGSSQFAVSRTGTLVYRTGGVDSGAATPVWVERDGTAREIEPGWSVATSRAGSSVAISPSGDRLAISIPSPAGTTDLWLKPLDAGPASRLTFEGATNRRATWSADGQSLTFVSDRAGQYDLWTKRADGSGSAALTLDHESGISFGQYSPGGDWLVFTGDVRPMGIYASPVEAGGIAGAPVETGVIGLSISLSPDGRWLAYVSNARGEPEVYVRPFPNTHEGLVQVSMNGGEHPVWAHNGRELFYRNGANELVVVQYSGDPTFAVGRREVLFSVVEYRAAPIRPTYDISPDDERFVMLRLGADVEAGAATYLVTNWFTELRERMGES